MSTEPDEVTVLLERIRQGSLQARDELITSLYKRFQMRAHLRLRLERAGHSLATTDLTNAALLRLLKSDEFAKAANHHELFRAFARAMRQELTDHARRRNADKRGGGMQREELDDLAEDVRRRGQADVLPQIEVLSLHESIEALQADHPREAEVLELRFFGSYEMAEVAEALGVSVSTVEKAFRFGRNWLRMFLSTEASHEA